MPKKSERTIEASAEQQTSRPRRKPPTFDTVRRRSGGGGRKKTAKGGKKSGRKRRGEGSNGAPRRTHPDVHEHGVGFTLHLSDTALNVSHALSRRLVVAWFESNPRSHTLA